jgi:exopolysaccharide biosynthesis polyprenyl glycosylphosphotransferase
VRKSTSEALRNLHLLLDAAVAVGALALTLPLHHALRTLLPWLPEPPPLSAYVALAYATPPSWVLLVVAFRLNRTFDDARPFFALVGSLVALHVAGLMGLSLLQFLLQSSASRSLVASFLCASFGLMLGLRMLLNQWARYQHQRGHTQPRLVLAGQPTLRMASFARDAAAGAFPPRLLGYLDPSVSTPGLSLPPADFQPLTRLGELDAPRLRALLHDEAVDEVLFFAPFDQPDAVPDCVAVCEELGIPASFAVTPAAIARSAAHVTSICEHPFLTVDAAPKRPELLALKHGLDAILAAALLIVLAPLLALTAACVLLAMGRPVLFVQQRAGLHGRPFAMFKFRSMVRGAESDEAPQASSDELGLPEKPEHDPRVTPLGRLLRRTSLDELPQLVNVLTGSMSLVGPRPLPLALQRHVRDWQRRRLTMKPGLTGLWQVRGRSQLSFDEWMALDLEYVEHWGLWLDLLILLRTVPVVLSGRGAR